MQRDKPVVRQHREGDGQSAGLANGSHVAFLADTREQVDAFWQTALKNGASGDGEPGPRPIYGEPYYGCFLRDPNGHKVEVMVWEEDPQDAG
ncbi:VOC family protein [Fodinicurvata halophila]|uniref:VOC family protein n=1 Tax=Fodinicurvata halophila TaxID=1419723 RepID=A0ABV8UM32_9PROT